MKKNTLYFLVTLILLLLFIGEIALLYYYSQKPWYDRLGFVLQIIGFYGVGLGFIQKSGLLKNFAGLDEMTSPNPIRFIRGNAVFLTQFFSVIAVGLDPNRGKSSSMALGCLGQILLMSLYPLLFIYVFFHLLVLCPLTYFAYVLVSAIVESVAGASADDEIISTSPDGKIQTVKVREIISSDIPAAKSLLIGIPATVLSLIAKGIGMFLG